MPEKCRYVENEKISHTYLEPLNRKREDHVYEEIKEIYEDTKEIENIELTRNNVKTIPKVIKRYILKKSQKIFIASVILLLIVCLIVAAVLLNFVPMNFAAKTNSKFKKKFIII